MGGCYMGRTPGRKTAAYAVNGTLVGVGLVGMASANGDEQEILTNISAIPLLIGLAGIVINLAVATEGSSSK